MGLTLNPSPDVSAGFIDITYDAGTQLLDAAGFALSFDGSSIAGGLLDISASVDGSGSLLSGTILVGGTVGPYASGTLLTGTLSDFGFSGTAAGMTFEITFAATGGDLAPLYAGTGGVIMASALNSFSGFGAGFDNLLFGLPGTGAGTADIGVTPSIPEPAAALLVGLGLVALAALRRS